jgi:2-methylcitrate dehydratase PrpD
MDPNHLLNLCQFLAQTHISALPARVLHHAKLVFLDTLGVIVAGSETPALRAMAERFSGTASRREGVTCPGLAGSFDPPWAAMLNGMAGSSLEFEEGNSRAMGHPAVQVVPAVMATAEAHALSGQDLLKGLVCGYETASRISGAASMRKGLHPTGTWGTVGAAVGAGCTLGREAGALVQVANIGASYAFSPYVRNSFGGRNVASTFAGMANMAGVLANLFYDSGVRADEQSLEMVFSRFLSEAFDGERLVSGLGREFAVEGNYIKPYPTCRFNHSALDALSGILRETTLRGEQIAGVRVESYRAAVHGDARRPPNVEAMRFSTPYLVAAMIRYGSIDLTVMKDAVLEDPVVTDLAERVEMVFLPEYERLRPERNPARVTVRLRDGREMVREVMNAPGDPRSPLAEKAVLSKFFSLTEPVLGAGKARSFVKRFQEVESEKDVRALMGLLRPGRIRKGKGNAPSK